MLLAASISIIMKEGLFTGHCCVLSRCYEKEEGNSPEATEEKEHPIRNNMMGQLTNK